jgi:hypothetical protein
VDERERRFDRLRRSPQFARCQRDASRRVAAGEPRWAKAFRQQRIHLFGKSAGLLLSDRRQLAYVDFGERVLRPFVRPPGVGMDREGDELLTFTSTSIGERLTPLNGASVR